MLMCDEFDLNSCYNEYDEELEIVDSASSHRNSLDKSHECDSNTEKNAEDHATSLLYETTDSHADFNASCTTVKETVNYLSNNGDIFGRLSTNSNSSNTTNLVNSSTTQCRTPAPARPSIYSSFGCGVQSSFVCDVCNKGFALKKYLRQHQLIHFGVRRFQCTICQQRFLRLGDLTRHYTIHSGERKYKCDHCDLSFTRKCYLNKHMVMHGEQYEIRSSESMSDTCQSNQNEHNFTSELSQLNCSMEMPNEDELSEPYGRPSNSTYEISAKHDLPDNSLHDNDTESSKSSIVNNSGAEDYGVLYECSVCDKMFTSRHYLRQHERVHFGKKIYECRICGERFQKMASLKEHTEIHATSTTTTNEINPAEIQLKDGLFLCDICGKGFQRKDSVKQHRVTHLNERLFQCNLCSKAFVHSSSLYKHKLKHNPS